MKLVTQALQAIAATIGTDFIRTMSLTEADFNVHNLNSDLDIIIYVGASNITNEFEGAQIVDTVEAEIYFIGISDSKDLNGLQMDDILERIKSLVDRTYAILNGEYSVRDIAPYSLEGVRILTDKYIGYRATIGISFYNPGCDG